MGRPPAGTRRDAVNIFVKQLFAASRPGGVVAAYAFGYGSSRWPVRVRRHIATRRWAAGAANDQAGMRETTRQSLRLVALPDDPGVVRTGPSLARPIIRLIYSGASSVRTDTVATAAALLFLRHRPVRLLVGGRCSRPRSTRSAGRRCRCSRRSARSRQPGAQRALYRVLDTGGLALGTASRAIVNFLVLRARSSAASAAWGSAGCGRVREVAPLGGDGAEPRGAPGACSSVDRHGGTAAQRARRAARSGSGSWPTPALPPVAGLGAGRLLASSAGGGARETTRRGETMRTPRAWAPRRSRAAALARRCGAVRRRPRSDPTQAALPPAASRDRRRATPGPALAGLLRLHQVGRGLLRRARRRPAWSAAGRPTRAGRRGDRPARGGRRQGPARRGYDGGRWARARRGARGGRATAQQVADFDVALTVSAIASSGPPHRPGHPEQLGFHLDIEHKKYDLSRCSRSWSQPTTSPRASTRSSRSTSTTAHSRPRSVRTRGLAPKIAALPAAPRAGKGVSSRAAPTTRCRGWPSCWSSRGGPRRRRSGAAAGTTYGRRWSRRQAVPGRHGLAAAAWPGKGTFRELNTRSPRGLRQDPSWTLERWRLGGHEFGAPPIVSHPGLSAPRVRGATGTGSIPELAMNVVVGKEYQGPRPRSRPSNEVPGLQPVLGGPAEASRRTSCCRRWRRTRLRGPQPLR